MKSIQVILIILSLFAAIIGSIAFRSRLAARLTAVLLFLIAALFVMFPNSSTEIAHALGVGRGTDLLVYLLLFAGVHSLLLLYIKIRKMERKITELVRAIAIQNAEQQKVRAATS